MISFFKKKLSPEPGVVELLISMLEEQPERFCELVERMSPGERVMTFVAYTVSEPVLIAAMAVMQERGQAFELN
jgi:hypothetical protein